MSPSRINAILATLFLLMFGLSCQFMVVAPILPRIGEALDIPEGLRGTLITSYAVCVGVFALVAGPISDRYGRRPILRAGSAAMAVSLLLHGVAWSFGSMLVLRALAGTSSGIMAGAAAAYIGDVFEYDQRGKAMGVLTSGMALGQIAGVPAGTLVADAFGFEWAFVAFGVAMAGAAVLCFAVLVPAPTGATERPTLRGALRTYGDLLRDKAIRAVTAAGALMMLSVSLYIIYMPSWLESTLGATARDVALLFGAGGVAQAVVGPITGKLSDRFGRKIFVVGASVPLGVVMAATASAATIPGATAIFFLVMVGASARMSPYQALLTALVPARRRGSLLSLSMSVSQAGFAAGSAVAGWVYTRSGYSTTAILAGVGTLAVGVLVGFFVPEPGGDL